MRILFTGATSFTGMWFTRALAAQGHRVLAVVRGSRTIYGGLRAQRLAQLEDRATFCWDTPFGTPRFLEAIRRGGPFDLFCHHAAEVKDYKSPQFDAAAAVAANTLELPAVLDALQSAGCRRILLTGSVFEADEGTGSLPLRAFSPYGQSKTRTAEIFREAANSCGFGLGKFVIPNPFGPYEEPRFTEYLIKAWKAGQTPRINTPAYVRDNVPVTLLASAYARFASDLPEGGFCKLNPSFYVENQGDFGQRFAREISQRLDIATPLELAVQDDFPEPAIRINTGPLSGSELGWSGMDFWDETARYYAGQFGIPLRRNG
jgi:UDP-glucose 4-epimerase